MTDDDNLLDGTVDEVKDRIDDATDVDYSSLLASEEEGKDRKTVKEYIESKMSNDTEDSEESEEDEVSEEEVLEEIEKETSGGILGSYPRNSVFAGGLILGLLIGLVAMGISGMPGGGADQISTADAQDRVTQIVGEQVQLSSFEEEHGLYTFNITSQGQQGNETVTRTQSFYMTLDGEKIIPKQSPLTGSSMVIDVDQAIQAAQQQNNQPPTNETTGNTTQ